MVGYTEADVGNYADGGVGLRTKATVFEHDGGNDDIQFTHVALVWSAGNPFGELVVASSPASMPTTAEPYVGVATTTDGAGVGLTVDISVINDGAALGDYSVTVNAPGYGYAEGDSITISNAVLDALDPAVGAGDLVATVGEIPGMASPTESIFAIAKTAQTVTLAGGNQSVFYWDFKQFGFYSAPTN